jgi:GT2 family glycosyltransferase/nucleoside-diphosphate-sugar epimerase
VEPLEDLAAADKRLRILRNWVNLGFAGGNNIALPMTSGDFVLFLNPDCIVQPETIEQMLAAFARHPEAGMAGCLILNPDGSEEKSCRRRLPTPSSLFAGLLGSGSHPVEPLPASPVLVEAISGAFMLVRRDDLERIGSFDTDYFMHWEDLDLCRRFGDAGRKILFVPDVKVRHFKGRSSQRRPLRVEWYKHRGLMIFLYKFHLRGWRRLLYPPVVATIAVRFLFRTLVSQFRTGAMLADSGSGPEVTGRREVWIFGASSLIGRHLLPRLVAAGYRVRAFCRNPAAANATESPHLSWHALDLRGILSLPVVGKPDVLIHLAPLFSLAPVLPLLIEHGLKNLVAFGSTSVFTKSESDVATEQQLARELADAENAIRTISENHGLHWSILRPTMIYSLGYDQNVTRLARFIRRFGFFPLPGQGYGLRQPVHADDLAKACVNLLETPTAWNRSYNLSGGETLSYRAMIELIFRRVGKRPRILCLPDVLWRIAIHLVRFLPGTRDLNMAMVRRGDIDLCFSHDEAAQAFSYQPRPFQP